MAGDVEVELPARDLIDESRRPHRKGSARPLVRQVPAKLGTRTSGSGESHALAPPSKSLNAPIAFELVERLQEPAVLGNAELPSESRDVHLSALECRRDALREVLHGK